MDVPALEGWFIELPPHTYCCRKRKSAPSIFTKLKNSEIMV